MTRRDTERYHQGPVTFRREMVPQATTDQHLLDTRSSTGWVHEDPWGSVTPRPIGDACS